MDKRILKEKRRKKQIERIKLVNTLFKALENYYDAHLCSSCVGTYDSLDEDMKLTYKGDDKYCDDALEYYSQYRDIVSQFDKDTATNIELMFRFIINKTLYSSLLMNAPLNSYCCDNVLSWANGNVTLDFVRNHILSLSSVILGRPIVIGSEQLRKDFIKIENVFYKFYNKKNECLFF